MTTLTMGSASTTVTVGSTVANAGDYLTPQQLQAATAYITASAGYITREEEIEIPEEDATLYVNTETEEALITISGGKEKALDDKRCLLCSNELVFKINIPILENGSLASYGHNEYWILTLCPKCKIIYERKRFRDNLIPQPPIQDTAWKPYPYTTSDPWVTTTTTTIPGNTSWTTCGWNDINTQWHTQ